MTSAVKSFGTINIYEHLRSGQATGKWRVAVPANISLSGKRERKNFSSLEEAETFATNYSKKDFGIDSDKIIQQNMGITFNQFLHYWFEEQKRKIKLKRKRQNSVNKDLGYLKSLQPIFGNKRLSEISRRLVEDYQISRTEKNFQATTINSETRTLKSILNMAVQFEVLEKCPVFEPLPEVKKHIELPKPDEMAKIISELRYELQLFCRIMAECGCR